MTLVERFHVDGEPRDAELTDFDNDGWNDAVVVIRDADKVQAYRNNQGQLILSAEAPVGKSPREIALADFNGDYCQDFVVVNRHSYDVSVVLGCGADAVSFQKLDQTYPVDGEVSGLLLADLNGDGRKDVLQLHRASSEVTVRLASVDGKLSTPSFYPAGLQPNGFEIADINGDTHLDVVTANLGSGSEPGSLSVLLGTGTGTLGTASVVQVESPTGQPIPHLLAVKAADFNGDNHADLVASFADARVAFFQGQGDGTFVPAADYSAGYPTFVFETRQFATGDFDQDGDIDLAGVGFFGELGVLANDGHLMSQTVLAPALYGARVLDSHLWYRARELRYEDLNNDHDPELVIGLDAGVAVFEGASGATFLPGQFQSGPGVPAQNTLPGIQFAVSGFAFGNFDQDTDRDLAVSCFADGCLTILTRETEPSSFHQAMKVRVPSAEFIAAGDVDGDGLDDLVGSGRTALWVALSGHAPELGSSETLQFSRTQVAHPVINELMSANEKTLLGHAGDRYPDWVELYNPTEQVLNLSGWSLHLTKQDGTTQDFTFPANYTIPPRGRKLVLCANNPGPDLVNTGYRLPDDGGTLRLRSSTGLVVDTVEYPAQNNDIAYARYADAVVAFTSTGMATPGSPNVYTGPIDPTLKFRGFDTENFTADVPVRLYAEAADDAAVLGVSLSWRRIDILNDTWHRVLFYDDGAHDDGAAADGIFAGTLQPGLPEGAAIQFYLEANDANNKTTYLPVSPEEGEDSGGSDLYVLAFGQGNSPIEITEVVSANASVYSDGSGTPDYVELGNVSAEPVLLDRYGLIDRGLNASDRFVFPPGTLLQPGQTILVLCDSNPDQGPFHARFGISSSGDKIYLQEATPSGEYVTVDAVDVPALQSNSSYSRIGPRGPWAILPATPLAANLNDALIKFRVRNMAGGQELTLNFAVDEGVPYWVESAPSPTGPWSTVSNGRGTQVAGAFSCPVQRDGDRFFRIRSE